MFQLFISHSQIKYYVLSHHNSKKQVSEVHYKRASKSKRVDWKRREGLLRVFQGEIVDPTLNHWNTLYTLDNLIAKLLFYHT